MVVVKGWHTETFSPSRLASSPEIFRFVEPGILKQGRQFFGGDGSTDQDPGGAGFASGSQARTQSLDLLRSKGVDAVISFRVMLTDLIQQVEVNRNYQKSDLLQILRILKIHGYFKEPQLELFKPRRRTKSQS